MVIAVREELVDSRVFSGFFFFFFRVDLDGWMGCDIGIGERRAPELRCNEMGRHKVVTPFVLLGLRQMRKEGIRLADQLKCSALDVSDPVSLAGMLIHPAR